MELKEIFINNEHLIEYLKLISLGLPMTYDSGHGVEGHEIHHIVPKSWFKSRQLPVDNSSVNCVLLTTYQHLLAHYHLCFLFVDPVDTKRYCSVFWRIMGIKSKHCLPEEQMDLSTLPQLAQLRDQMRSYRSQLCKGTKVYNNGKIQVRRRECPEGFVPGGLPKSDEYKAHVREVLLKRDPEIYRRVAIKNSRKKRPAEVKTQMSQSRKGRISPTKGKHLSLERRQQIREARLGSKQSSETKERRRQSMSKLKWYNNGESCCRALQCPEGYVPGRLKVHTEESKCKFNQQGKSWFTNGVKNTMQFSCPDGYWPGRTKALS